MGSPRTKWCQIGTRSHFRTLFFFGTLKAAPISISIPHHFEQIMKTRVFSDNFNLLCQGTTSEAQLFEVVSDRTTSLAPRTIFESHLPEKVSAKIALNFHIFFPQKHLVIWPFLGFCTSFHHFFAPPKVGSDFPGGSDVNVFKLEQQLGPVNLATCWNFQFRER